MSSWRSSTLHRYRITFSPQTLPQSPVPDSTVKHPPSILKKTLHILPSTLSRAYKPSHTGPCSPYGLGVAATEGCRCIRGTVVTVFSWHLHGRRGPALKFCHKYLSFTYTNNKPEGQRARTARIALGTFQSTYPSPDLHSRPEI